MSEELQRRLELAWDRVAARAEADDTRLGEQLRRLVREARSRSELRNLFPFTSVNRLCFSRSSEYPYTTDCPCIAFGDGTFAVQTNWVVSADGHEAPLVEDATTNIDRVLQLAIDHLPHERTVWLGTRDDN